MLPKNSLKCWAADTHHRQVSCQEAGPAATEFVKTEPSAGEVSQTRSMLLTVVREKRHVQPAAKSLDQRAVQDFQHTNGACNRLQKEDPTADLWYHTRPYR